MRTLLFGSIRRSLIVLVLLAVLPSLGILLWTGRELRSRVVQDAENYALRQVQAMAAHHERVVENARLMLMALARSSEVRNLDANACQTLLSEILVRNTAYVSLVLTDTDGHILATAPPGLSMEFQTTGFFGAALATLAGALAAFTGAFLATGFAAGLLALLTGLAAAFFTGALATGLAGLLTLAGAFLAGAALATALAAGLVVFLAAVLGLVAMAASVASLRRDG